MGSRSTSPVDEAIPKKIGARPFRVHGSGCRPIISAGRAEELVFQGRGRHAGVEISGQLRDILDTRQITR
jgi:hypothetical protein